LRRLSFFEQRGQWTDFNGTVPLFSTPREKEKLSGLLLKRGWHMATIIKHGDGYQVKIRRKNCIPVSKTFPTHQLAKDWAITTESEMIRGQYVCRHSAENTSLRDALERYSVEISAEKPGAATERYRIRLLQSQPFASRSLSSLRPEDFIKYRDERRHCLRQNLSTADKRVAEAARKRKDLASLPKTFFVSDCTVRKELRLISHLFNIAKRCWNIYVDNPIQSIKLPPEGEPRTIRIQPDQYTKLLAAFDTFQNPHIKPFILFLVETALRRGEALSLLWDDVRLEQRFILLRKGKNQKPRQVPLSTSAVAVLQNLPRNSDSLYIFPISTDVVKQSMRTAIRRAGLIGSGICTHTLRHEACSRLGDRGFTAVQIAAVSGHQTLQLVARYAHIDVLALAKQMG